MADIVCVAPPFRYKKLDTAAPICPHLGISSCAAVWREAGYAVRILDVLAQNLVWDDIRKVLEAERPKVLAMTSVTASFPTALDIMQKAKSLDPGIITILGGPHVTNMPETANHDCIDYIIINEGEDSGLELVNVLLRGQGALEKIGGIGFKQDGRLVLTPPRPFIADLDRLPFLPYDLLPMGSYRNYATLDDGRRFFSFMTTRGCPFHCIFCDSAEVFGHKYRQMSVERVIKELQFMYYRHDIRHVYFQDDEFTINRRRVDQFCDAMLAAKMDLRWGGLARVSDLADGGEIFVEKMARAGCRELAFGTEVGYQEGLDQIKKKITLQQTREAMRLCRKYNILSSASFTMGYPWEAPEHIRQTIRFAKSIDADIYYFQVLIPYPGTELYRMAKEEGLIVRNDWSDYIQHSIAGSEPVVRTRHMTNEELKYWNARCFLEVYFDPRYLVRKLVRSRGATHLTRNVESGLGLLRNCLVRIWETRFGRAAELPGLADPESRRVAPPAPPPTPSPTGSAVFPLTPVH